MGSAEDEWSGRTSRVHDALHPAAGVGLWILATLVATTAIGFGVSAATRSVIGAPLPTLGAPDVARLAAETTTTSSTSTTTTRAAATTGGSTSATVAPTPSTTAAAAEVTSTTAVRTTTTSEPATRAKPKRRAPPSVSATLENGGGFVNVICVGGEISLESAIPANGYNATVLSTGPRRVDVTFTSADGIAPIAAICARGRPILQPPPASRPPPPPPTQPPPSALGH